MSVSPVGDRMNASVRTKAKSMMAPRDCFLQAPTIIK